MGNKILKLLGIISGAICGVLGFTSCNGTEYMYGSPYTEYKVSGLVTDKAGAPVNKARILLRKYSDGYGNFNYSRYATDTAYTDTKGKYSFEGRDISDNIRVVCDDPSGAYEADSTDVKLHYVEDGRKDDGWCMGTANETVNFTLRPSESDHE